MSSRSKSAKDNQVIGKDKRPVYIQGPVSQITPTDTNRAIDDVKPADQTLVVKPSKLRRPLSSPAFFQAILRSAGPSKRSHLKLRKPGRGKIMLFFTAAAFLIMGGYFTYQGINSVRASGLSANLTSFSGGSGISIGSTTTNNALSTVKVTASDLANYTVAPNLPRYLKIPKLGVDARVLAVGLNKDGSMGTPEDIYDTAWYNGSAQPGQPGAVVIDGHVSGWSAHGVFYGLKSLSVGDQIQIQRGDGALINYKVVKTQAYPAANVNMNQVLSPVISGQQGLNLITCTGDVLPGTSSYSQRLVVFATQS